MLWPLEECTTELFTSLQTIKSLEHLDLSDTGINTVKPVADLAAALPSLKYVNMSSCYIDPGEDDVQATKYLLTHMDEFRIPVGILDQFTEEDWEEVLTSDSLKHFHLSDMNDTIVENIMKSLEKNTSIEHFSIEQYSESHFDSWLNNVKTLKTLMLDYSAVPSIGDNHTNVTRLSLQSVECSDFEALFASLIKLFSVNSVLEELNLKGLDFEKVTAEFFEALSKTPIKTLICIPGDTIPDAGDVLSKLISDSKTLTSIDLTEAQLSFDDLTKIFNSLPKTNSLQKLILNRNKITPNEGEEDTISEALGNAIANNQSITSLSLNQTGAKDTTIEKLGAALAKNGTLTELNLEVNEDIKLIYPIFNALVNNTSLKTLNLNQCSHVSDWTKIPELPVSQLSLAYLSIAYHGGLGDTGFSALASILEKNTSITKLDISNCRLTDSSIATILTALHKNKTLKYLYMRNNTSVELEGPLVQLIQHTPLAYLNVYGSSVKGREIVLNDNWYKSFLVQS